MSFDLAAILCNQPYEIPVHHTPVSIDSHIYDTYVGTYEYKGLLYKIVREHDTIYFKQPDKEMYALIPESQTDFFIKDIPITIRIMKNAQGEVDHMVTKAFGKERLLYKNENRAT